VLYSGLNRHCKKVIVFPVPSQDITMAKLYVRVPGREFFNYSRRGRVWLVTFRLETGKRLSFFYTGNYDLLKFLLVLECYHAAVHNLGFT
jgi:hypothetical protein